MVDAPQFSGINYTVCDYCANMVRAMCWGYIGGCGLRTNVEGKYARLTMGDKGVEDLKAVGIDAVNELKGCDQFRYNGLPCHPSVLEVLVQKNPLCAVVTADPSATETYREFDLKVNPYLSPENFVNFTKIKG